MAYYQETAEWTPSDPDWNSALCEMYQEPEVMTVRYKISIGDAV